MIRIIGQLCHESVSICLKIGFGSGLALRTYRLLQVIIQVLIRIVFRRIGGQKEKPDLGLVLLNPFGNERPVMNLEVVQNDVDLVVNILDQTLQKLHQLLLIQTVDKFRG